MLAVMLGLVLMVGLPEMAQATMVQATPNGEAPERNIKAASLYKFFGYVEWPGTSFEKPDSPFVVGVVGANAIADELERIAAGRSINRRAVTVRRLKASEPLPEMHMLFVGQDESARLDHLIKRVQQRPVLIVTETAGALGFGSMINFRVVDGRVRFEISLIAAEKSNIRLSSRMLPIAVSVQKAQP